MFGTLGDISAVIALCQALSLIVLLPAMLNKKTYIVRKSSGLTAAILFILGLCNLDLTLWLGAAATFCSVGLWLAMFVWRGRPKAI
jgi:hypothetical protein